MVALRSAFFDYRPRMYWVQWDSLHKDRAMDRFLIQPAVLGQSGVAEWQRNWMIAHSDFAATISVARSAEATGAFSQTTQLFVSVITHDPRLMHVSDLPKGKRRTRLEKDGVKCYPYADTTVVFAFSNANNDTKFYHSVACQVMEVLHTGAAPARSKMEFIMDGVRLSGSDTSQTLRDDLVEYSEASGQPKPIIQSGHSGRSYVKLCDDRVSFQLADQDGAPPVEQRSKLLELRDGCKAQFQGRNGFLHYALFERITGVGLANVCCEAENGKGAADGCSRVVSQGSRTLALQGENPGAESRGLFELIAAKRQRPTVPRIEKESLTAVTQHLFVYGGPADGSALADCRAHAGYDGSTKDHHFMMDPSSRAANPRGCDLGYIQHTNRACPCDRCLSGKPDDCSVRRLFKNARGRHMIERKKGIACRAASRSRVTTAWVNSVKVGTVVVVRVHADEPNELNELYYLGVVDRDHDDDLLCWRNKKTQAVGQGNVVNKNVWLVRFRWLHYRPAAVASSPSAADKAQYRAYQFQPCETTVVFPAAGVVTRRATCEAAQALRQNGNFRWLPKGAHGKIIEDGLDLIA